MSLSEELLELIACPACRGELLPDAGQAALLCPACRLRYPVRDGIPILTADQALRADADADPDNGGAAGARVKDR